MNSYLTVDWEQQWELFAENFYDGKAHSGREQEVGMARPIRTRAFGLDGLGLCGLILMSLLN
jgi:hypothetical protein